MRRIDKRTEPGEHREWCSRNKGDINFGYELMDAGHRALLKKALLIEQGWICAYTGRRLADESSHIEHLRPQKAWKEEHRVLDVAYSNLVACWPAPGHKPEPEDGARYKDNWPEPGQEFLFVSPLNPGCDDRFVFGTKGKISTKPGDKAAEETVRRLGLDGGVLTDLRRIAITSIVGKDRSLSLADARTRLRDIETAEQQLKQGDEVKLDPYCFAVKQALQKHIRAVEGIRRSRRKS